MAKMSKENALWILVQMSRSSFYGPNVIEALRMGIDALRKANDYYKENKPQ